MSDHLGLDRLQLRLRLVLQVRWGALSRRPTFCKEYPGCCVKNGPWTGKSRSRETREQAIAGNLETVSSAYIYLGDGINRIFDMESMRNTGIKGNTKILA